MKKHFFIILLLTLSVSVFSQKKEVVEKEGVQSNITQSYGVINIGSKSKIAKEYFNKGFDFSENGDLVNAEKFYLKAIKEDSNYYEAYDNIGLTYRKLTKYDDAIKYYLKAILLYPNQVSAHQNLASAYSITKKLELAIQQYEEILKIEPNNPEGYFGLGNAYMMLSKFDKALINSKKATELYISENSHYISEGYYLSGLISYYSGNKEEAKEFFILTKNHGGKLDERIEKELFSGSKEIKENQGIKLKTDEDFAKNEPLVLKAYDWLLNTPVGEKPETRKQINAFLMQWMTGAPNVSIEIKQEIVPYMDCGECLMIFMGGFTKYALETKDFSKLKANIAGTAAVIKFYNANKKQLGVQKEIEKFIKLKNKNKLEKYLKKYI
jgi:Flp pilus assembly protein TadD